MADTKIGAYICKGCGLGERLDTDKLESIASGEGKAAICRQEEFLCQQSTVDKIQADIDNEGINRVVIGACSRRAKFEAFNFESTCVSRVNLREGVIWVRPDTEEAKEATQEMAEDYIRMGCTEVKFMSPPSASQEQSVNKHLLVVGGGITGMTSAIEASKAGYQVSIIEKTSQLGGVAGQLHRKVPSRMPYASPQDNGIDDLNNQISANSNITVYLNSTTTKTSGAPGRFSVDITTESGSTTTENFGAIIQASGFTPYDANKLPEFAYGKTPDVVDQLGLEKLAQEANGTPIKRP